LAVAAIAGAPGLAAAAGGTARTAKPDTATAPATQAREQFVDGIAAVVNKQVITLSQLRDRVQAARKQLAQHKIAPPDDHTLRMQVLNRMIDTELEQQEAARVGIHVTDAQLQAAIQSIADRNKMSLADLKKKVEESGIDWNQYQRQVRHEVLVAQLRRREVDSTIVITDADVDAYLKTHGGDQNLLAGSSSRQSNAASAARQAAGPVMLGLGQILVAVPENASATTVATLRKKAQVILAKLRAGADFASLAAAASDGPQALNGGNIGTRPVKGWPDLFIAATKGLEKGQITDIIQSGNGFHILKILSRTSAAPQGARAPAQNPQQQAEASDSKLDHGPKMVTQTHARHILIKVDKVTTSEQAREKLVRLRARIEHGESFATLAKRYSQDSSAPQGGDLGWLNPGETVAPFQHAMDALKPGEISEPVETKFGWHLIQVLARRTKNMASEYNRVKARQILFERRAGPAFEDWLGKLRAQAYVDIRIKPVDTGVGAGHPLPDQAENR
jgi:peptidyl-prolyl cis-trans isomerase SurA